MTWVRLDDAFVDHPKVVGLSSRAFRSYVHGLCYSARHLTDGRIPPAAQTGGRTIRDELVSARLWALDEDGSVVVHNYLEWNPPAVQVRARRESDSARKRSGTSADSEQNPDGIRASRPVLSTEKSLQTKDFSCRPRDDVWDALEALFGYVAPKSSAHGKRNAAVADLKRSGATAESVQSAYRKYLKLFDHTTPTDTALAKHYPQLVHGTIHAPKPPEAPPLVTVPADDVLGEM